MGVLFSRNKVDIYTPQLKQNVVVSDRLEQILDNVVQKKCDQRGIQVDARGFITFRKIPKR